MLDPSSATELLTQQPQEQPKPYKARHKPAEKITVRSEYVKDGAYCDSHPDEEVTYFCFDCLIPPVCSECVIHGVHKDHEVMHVKKGYLVVKEKLEEVIQGLATSVESLQNDRKMLENKKELVIDQANATKAQLKTLIDDLISRIDKKEKELMHHIDLSTEKTLKELESCERVIEKNMGTLSNNIEYIQENMEGGPVFTLNFYADNNKLLLQVADQSSQKDDRYESRLVAGSVIAPDAVLREVKVAASAVTEAVARMRFGARKSARESSAQKSFSKNSVEADEYS